MTALLEWLKEAIKQAHNLRDGLSRNWDQELMEYIQSGITGFSQAKWFIENRMQRDKVTDLFAHIRDGKKEITAIDILDIAKKLHLPQEEVLKIYDKNWR